MELGACAVRAAAALCAVLLAAAAATPPAKLEGKRDHCNKTVDIYEDVSSPSVTADNYGRPLTCSYRFRAFRGSPKDWILRIRFHKFKVGQLVNGTTCHAGYLQIVDGNAKTDVSNRKEPGLFCGEIEQPQTFISETSVVKVIFHADNFTDQTYFSFDSRAEQQFEVYLRYGQHPELYPNRRGEVVAGSYCERVFRDCRLQTCYVQSAAYPGVYPRNLHCRYHLNTRLPYIKLYIENEEFNVDGQRCENIMTCPMRAITSAADGCPYDYIRIYDGKDESSPLIGTFCGMGKFPYSIIGTSQDLFVEFVSSPAGPLLNTGFHFNVGNWPGHVEAAGQRAGACDWLLTADALRAAGDSEGIFLSVAHWYPPHTSCTYLMRGAPGQIVRLYFPSFRINRIESPIVPHDGDCGESLTLYDSDRADDARIIKTFCDTFSRPMEKHDFVSTGNAMFVRFESKTGSYSGASLYYWAHYDFFNDTKSGEPIPGTQCDEVLAAWRAESGVLRSPVNTLVYKRTTAGDDVRCLYRFVTDRRLFARVILSITMIAFKEHPYAAGSCQHCYEDRTDKLVIWEPSADNATVSLHAVVQRGLGACLCSKHAPLVARARPFRVVSRGDRLNLQMIVDGAHAAASYFKHAAPLWEARYEFAHGPLCGPAVLPAGSDGEITFPALAALGYADPPKRSHCIWDLELEEKRDVWLRLERVRLPRRCADGVLELFLPGRVEPYLTVCGDNASVARELPILSAAELGLDSLERPAAGDNPRAIRVVFHGDLHSSFRVAWTGLSHLPRDAERLVSCDFLCPGAEGRCIPARLVCNGVANCPNATAPEPDDAGRRHLVEDSLRRLGLLEEGESAPSRLLGDEAPELCAKRASTVGAGDATAWTAARVGGAAAAALAALVLVVWCRRRCRKRAPEPVLSPRY